MRYTDSCVVCTLHIYVVYTGCGLKRGKGCAQQQYMPQQRNVIEGGHVYGIKEEYNNAKGLRTNRDDGDQRPRTVALKKLHGETYRIS